MPERKEQSILEKRKSNKEYIKKRLRILLIIGFLLLIILGLIIWASIRLGGIQNVFKGNGNVVTNTVSNIGNAISSTGTPTPTPTEFTILDIPTDPDLTASRIKNSFVFTNGSSIYEIKVKVGTQVEFVNQTGKQIGLRFSDGREVRIEAFGNNYETFLKTGTFTFADQIDIKRLQITGQIIVVN